MSAPVASVVIPTYSGAHRLPALLDALVEQDVAGSWEVVVALDGVHDRTPELLEQYAARLPLRVLVAAVPRGLCATLNAAYSAADGQVLIRCDDDLSPRPDMVRRHVAWHEYTAASVGVIGLTRDLFDDTPYARSYGRPANDRQRSAAYAREPGRRWMHWAAHNSMTRESWERVGGFDPRFRYREDGDLGLRLHRSGVSIVIDPALEIGHRGPATSARTRASRAFVSGSSRRLFEAVHPGSATTVAAPDGLRARAWNAATAGVSALVRTPAGCARLGALADELPGWVVDRDRARLIAFAVEAADRSGYRNGRDDVDEFRTQKSLEISTERNDPGPEVSARSRQA
jgi:glycosyltransferase involved in cell wall biosynthesis